MHRRTAILCTLALALAACSPSPATTIRPTSPGGPTATSDAEEPDTTRGTSDGAAGAAEPGVIKGQVTDAQGDPIAGAQMRLTGYTASFNGSDEDLVTDASGVYRAEVTDGLWEVHGEAAIEFDGEPYVFDLRPADGDCEAQMSSGGIVKDFVLEISGLDVCYDYVDPESEGSYNGATVVLDYQAPRSLPADAQLEFTLEPMGPTADGSDGRVVTFDRTAAALESSFGDLDETAYLYDIPLGNYEMSGTATLPDGSTQQLRFASELGGAPAESVDVSFEPVQMFPYGIRRQTIVVVDANWQ
jgi:hypothetical protein